MKAKFFFLGLCALALAACSIDEVSQVNDTNAVTFKATTITRADVTTTNNLSSFSVWAWNTDNNNVVNEFMTDVIATRQSSGSNTFTTSPLYFWPTGSVDFYALAPATEVHGVENGTEYYYLGGEIDEGDDVNPDWSYTGNVAKAQIENGEIVIDAVIPSTPEEQIDLCYGVAIGKSSGSVPMNFRHALSQIAFKAKSANEAFEVKIADVSVCSVYKEGVFTITDQDTSTHLDEGTSTEPASSSQGTWAITEQDEAGYAIKGRFLVDMTDSVVEVPTDGSVVELVDPNGTLMLLPQEVVAWDPLTDYSDAELGGYIRILCHVEEAGSQLWPNNAAEAEEADLEETGAFWTDEEGVEYAEIAVPLNDIEWEQGYRYTYTIIFGEGLGYYPPDDPNADLEGTPVLDIITFDVTVDEFQDAEATTDGQFDIPTDTDLSEIKVSSYEELVGALRMGYAVIDVAESIEVTAALEVYQDCVLNLEAGVTISYPDSSVDHDYGSSIIMVYGGTLTINAEDSAGLATSGTSEAGDCSCIWLNGGNVIINGGSFYGASWNDDGYYQYASATIYAQNGFAYIYGGEFYGGYAYLWKEDSILNCKDANREAGNAWIYVYGGDYYSFDPANCGAEGTPTNFCADGYGTVSSTDADGKTCYTVIKTTVTSLDDLKAAIDAGASEITIDEAIELEQGDVLYFTNDCHLTLNEDLTYAPVSDYTGGDNSSTSLSIIVVAGGATLTIDAADDVNIACDGNNGNNGDDWVSCISVGTYFTDETDNDPGHLIINGGNYKGGVWQDTDNNYTSVPTIYIFCGDVEINGGNFVGGWSKWSGDGYTYGDTGWAANILNCSDTPRKKNTDENTYAWFNVKGGSFREFNPGDNASEGNHTNYVVEGHTSTSSTGSDGFTWWTVTEN